MPGGNNVATHGLFIVEMEVATGSSDNIGNISLLGCRICELACEALVIMDMTGKHNIRNPSGCVNRIIEDLAHIGTSTMESIIRIYWVMHSDDESLLLRGSLQLCLEPGNLVVVKLATFWHIRIEADKGSEGCIQGPIDVGL